MARRIHHTRPHAHMPTRFHPARTQAPRVPQTESSPGLDILWLHCSDALSPVPTPIHPLSGFSVCGNDSAKTAEQKVWVVGGGVEGGAGPRSRAPRRGGWAWLREAAAALPKYPAPASAALGRCARPSAVAQNAFHDLPDVPERGGRWPPSAARGQRPRDPAPRGRWCPG